MVREKQAEIAAAAAPAPAAPVAAAQPPPADDPVIGQWLLESGSKLTLEADHTITGDRHGTWVHTDEPKGGHHYQLRWNPPKDWVDYVDISDDGKALTGKTRGGKPISLSRP